MPHYSRQRQEEPGGNPHAATERAAHGTAGSGRQLLVQLRRLKGHSGLSLAALASRTGHSRSSWERYLNGKKPAPRQAVEALCALTGTSPGRLAGTL